MREVWNMGWSHDPAQAFHSGRQDKSACIGLPGHPSLRPRCGPLQIPQLSYLGLLELLPRGENLVSVPLSSGKSSLELGDQSSILNVLFHRGYEVCHANRIFRLLSYS